MAALLAALLVLGTTASFAQGPNGGPPQGSPRVSSDEDLAVALRSQAARDGVARESERQREEERRRAAWRRSDEAREERLASRGRYRGQTADAARTLLREEHGHVLDAFDWTPSELLNDGLIVEYLDDFSARIKTPEGDVQLLESTSGLRMKDASGDAVPVDLSLEHVGERLAPRRAPVATSLPGRADDAFRVGAPPVGLAVSGAAGVPPVVSGGHDAVYANAFTDTDLVAKPLVEGLELFVHVRSAQAPEAFPIDLALPDGATLRQRDGGVDVTAGGERIGSLLAPSALDAQGADVPVDYVVDGGRVTLRVEHRARDYAYPLLVDPLYENWVVNGPGDYSGGWLNNQHLDGLNYWDWTEWPGSLFPHAKSCLNNIGCQGTTSPYPGLYVYTSAGSQLGVDSYGEWYYAVPGSTTFIPRVEFHKWYHQSRGNVPMEAFMGIFGRSWAWSGLYATTAEADRRVDTVQPTPGGYLDGAAAVFGFRAPDNQVKRPNVSNVLLGGAHITIDDPEAPGQPTVTAGEPPTHWVHQYTQNVTVSASDPGLGVRFLRNYFPGLPQQSNGTGCTGLRSSPCGSYSHGYSFSTGSWAEGHRTLEWDAVDPVGHVSSRLVRTIKVDHTPPSFTLSGLSTRRAIGAGLHPLSVTVKDRPDGSSLPVSGARRAEVHVDGVNESTFQTSGCTDNCVLTATHQFDGNAPLPPDGEDTFTDTSGKTLQTHTPQRGGPWVKHPSTTGDAVINAAGRVRRNTTGTAMYTLSAVPQSADYDVETDLYVASLDPQSKDEVVSLVARADPTTRNYYEATYDFDPAKGRWCIYRVTPSLRTEIGCAAPAQSMYAAGQTHRAVFRLRGNRLAVVVDGAELVTAIDSTITAAGRAGLKLGPDGGASFGDGYGGHFDNFEVNSTLGTTRYPEGRHQVEVDANDGVALSATNQTFPIIVDRTKPSITSATGPLRTNPRIKKGIHDLNITATDPAPAGLAWPDIAGIGRIEVWTRPAGSTTWSREHNAPTSSPTQTHSTTFGFDTATHADGKWDVEVRAYDAADNEATRVTFQVDVDANGPVLTVNGSLRDPLGPDRAMHVEAVDTPNGVRRIRGWIRPAGAPRDLNAPTIIDQDCTLVPKMAPCAADYVAPPMSEGTYTVLIIAEDRFRDSTNEQDPGNTSEQEWTLNVVDTRATDRTKLGLEHYFHYDETDAGGRSTLAVNGEGGNTVWHSVPVVNPGRGVSTVVNLTYNSHERGGLLGDIYHRMPVVDATAPALADLAGFTYGEAGIGFSLGVSGPTRVNEPLGGVLLAQALDEDGLAATAPPPITMTDADGTRHTFTNRSANYWRDTDGMNLHLRQYKPGGSLLTPIADKWAMTRSDGVTYFFNSHGYLTKIADRNQNALTYTYENINGFTGTACPTNAVIGKYVPPAGTTAALLCYPRLIRVTDPGGRHLRIEYRSMPGPLEAIGSDFRANFPVDYPAIVGGKAGRIGAIVDHADRRYEFTYDADGYLKVFREAAGTPDERATRLIYEGGDANCPLPSGTGRTKQLCKVVELRDGTDANTTIEETEQHANTHVKHDATSCRADGGFNPPRQAGELRNRTYNFADGSGGFKDYQYVCGGSGSGGDAFTTVQRLIGTNNATTSAYLDGIGRPTRISDPARNQDLVWHADATENKVVRHVVAPMTAEERQETEFSYDTSNGTGVLTQKKELGDIASTSDDRVTAFGYQFSLGRHQAPGDAGKAFVADLTSLVPPRGDEAKWTFTVEPLTGNVTERRDALGRVARTEYDAVGRVRKEIPETIAGDDPDVRPVIYGGADGLQFHPTGMPLEIADQRGGTWRYAYDAVGNPTLVADPRAHAGAFKSGDPFVTTLTWDKLDRLTREHIPKRSSAPFNAFIARSRTFDRNDNVTTATDGESAKTTIEYTKTDQPSRVLAPGSNGTETTRYAYDAADRLIGIVAPKGVEATAGLMRGEHLDACSTGQAPLHAFTIRLCLDGVGRRIAEVQTAPDQPTGEQRKIRSFAFDRRDNLLGVIDPARNANRTVQQALDAVAARDNRRYINTYNRFDELTQAVERPTETTNGSVVETVRNFAYDKNGNRVSETNPRNQSWVTNYSYDHRDQLESILGPSVKFNEPSTQTARPLTCIKRREDGLVAAETLPRGTAADHARCTNDVTTDHYEHFTKRYRYDAGGDVLEESIPYAPGQYHTPAGATQPSAASWKLKYLQRDLVGNPTQIRDPRGNAFLNEFLDTGELRWTQRPSYWGLRWPGEGHGTPGAGDRFGGRSAIDGEIGTGGPAVELRRGGSANTARSGEQGRKPQSLGQTDFGRVDAEPLPGLLPQAGDTELKYDDELRLEDIVDARQRVRHIRYDAAGRVRSKSWPYKPATVASAERRIDHAFDYDANGNLLSYRDGRSFTTSFTYDGYDRVTQETAPGARSSRDNNVLPPNSTAVAEVTRFDYDLNDNPELRRTPQGHPNPTAVAFTYDYDSLDRLTREANPVGDHWDYEYDVAGNRTLERRPRHDGVSETQRDQYRRLFTYDELDRLDTTTDRARVAVRRNDSETTEVQDLVTDRGYDLDGNQIRTVMPGARDKIDVDQDTADPTPRVVTQTFDGRGLPWRRTVGVGFANPRTTTTEFDANGNLRRVVNPAAGASPVPDTGNAEEAARDATVRTYDAHDLLTSVELPWNDADPRRFAQEFQRNDPLRRVTSILSPHVDSDNTVARTSYTYYDTDWIASVSDEKITKPSLQSRVQSRLVDYDFDEGGNQTRWETKNADNQNGREIERTFWPNGLLRSRKARKFVNGTPSFREYEYLYNRNRSLVEFVDQRDVLTSPDDDRSTKVTRDDAERPLIVNEAWAVGKDTKFAYDAAGNVTTRWTDGVASSSDFTGAEAKRTTFVYDGLDRETTMTVDAPGSEPDRTTTTNYHASSERFRRNKPNGTVDFWLRNTRGELVEHKRDPVSGATESDTYDYDANGNRTKDERGTHEFNARGQHTRWVRPVAQGRAKSGWSVEYTLNGDGALARRTERNADNAQQIVTDFDYRGERLVHTLTTDHTNQPAVKTLADYKYDDFGNVVRIDHEVQSDVSTVLPPPQDSDLNPEPCALPEQTTNEHTYYCYDEFERMTFSRGQGVDQPAEVTHDGLDRRDTRKVGSVTRDYSYVGLSELLSREGTSGSTSQTYDYDSSGGRQGVDRSDKPYRPYANDANGSVTGLESSADGSIAEADRYRFDPYGQLENADGDPIETGGDPPTEGGLSDEAAGNPFRFEGFYYDSGVRTYDMHARHYRPDIGRYLTQDRYASAAGDMNLQADPLTQNRYAFASGNPVSNVEFDGHKFDGGGGIGGPRTAEGRPTTVDKAHPSPGSDPVVVSTQNSGSAQRRIRAQILAERLEQLEQVTAAVRAGVARHVPHRHLSADDPIPPERVDGLFERKAVELEDYREWEEDVREQFARTCGSITHHPALAARGQIMCELQKTGGPITDRPGTFDVALFALTAMIRVGPRGGGGAPRGGGGARGGGGGSRFTPGGGGVPPQQTVTALTREQTIALEKAWTDKNTVHHIFGKQQHNLGPLVRHFGGGETGQIALLREAVLTVPRNTPPGTFVHSRQIGPYTLTTRGRMIDGVPRIGTVFAK
ncbi:MAG TPA: RHS repeat-associated core domain-containing protein [Solirubrobacteraceae bacterium]|nr:RHS repeat-associated core domain-containing protein [Solirubrobacteraceae bacterium]